MTRMKTNYGAQLGSVESELKKALHAGARPASDVALLWSATRTFARLQHEDLEDLNPLPAREIPLKSAVWTALWLLGKPSTPSEIRDCLLKLGYDLRRYTFPIGNVHHALQANIRAGLTSRSDESGTALYIWHGDDLTSPDRKKYVRQANTLLARARKRRRL